MKALLEFLKKYYYWIVFLLLESYSIHLLVRYNTYQGSVWCTSANAVAGTINGWHKEFISYTRLKKVNATLTSENIFLQKQVADLRRELDKIQTSPSSNDRLVRDSLKGFTLIPAKVVSNSLTRDENYIVIDKGEKEGIHEDMGVVGGGGVVGIVFMTTPHYSLVMPSINVKSSISCRIRHSNYFGYLQWNGGSTCTAVMNDVPHYARVRIGEYVETSGYSSVFPSGIFVGKVSGISNSPDGLSLQLKVSLGTNFGNLTDVCVIVNDRAQLDPLQQKLDAFESEGQ